MQEIRTTAVSTFFLDIIQGWQQRMLYLFRKWKEYIQQQYPRSFGTHFFFFPVEYHDDGCLANKKQQRKNGSGTAVDTEMLESSTVTLGWLEDTLRKLTWTELLSG